MRLKLDEGRRKYETREKIKENNKKGFKKEEKRKKWDATGWLNDQ